MSADTVHNTSRDKVGPSTFQQISLKTHPGPKLDPGISADFVQTHLGPKLGPVHISRHSFVECEVWSEVCDVGSVEMRV